MQRCRIIQTFIFLMVLVNSHTATAVWFEATGQAVIHNGETQAARQQATQEAIKQALLFSGASVKSIQSLANGLLEDDRFEVRASGEVNSIELIDEIYHQDYISVSIRADIFPQGSQCAAADYKKNIVTTWYNINKRQQAAVGNLYDFGKVLANKLQAQAQDLALHTNIHRIEPYYLNPADSDKKDAAFSLAQKTDAQYVLFGEILEFGIETTHPSKLKFWENPSHHRNLTLGFALYDGSSGEMVWQNTQAMSTQWDFDLHQTIASNGKQLWDSSFGLAAEKALSTVVQEIDETISCLPAYGRVLKVNSESLSINMGKHNGVKLGDTLTLFQVNQFYDTQNTQHRQFRLHPEQVVVKQVYAGTAVVASLSGAPLANIQANDFVARR